VIRVLDAIADWLMDVLSARVQLRAGVLLVLLSIPLFVYAPFSGEPLLIYLMSALAISLTGVSIVLGAEVLEQTEDGDGASDPTP
jgi:hypothetical protein